MLNLFMRWLIKKICRNITCNIKPPFFFFSPKKFQLTQDVGEILQPTKSLYPLSILHQYMASTPKIR